MNRSEIAELNPEALFADGFDSALIGTVQVWVDQSPRTLALYDRDKCIKILAEQGMTPEEAEEYFEFNVVGAYLGPNTPAFASVSRV